VNALTCHEVVGSLLVICCAKSDGISCPRLILVSGVMVFVDLRLCPKWYTFNNDVVRAWESVHDGGGADIF